MKEFNDNDMFCKECFLHNTLRSGRYRGVYHCPVCGCQETIMYSEMNYIQRYKTYKIFENRRKETRINIIKEN